MNEDDEFHPAESYTPIPPTPLLYGRAPTPHPYAGGEGQPSTYLPGVSDRIPRPPTPLPDKLEAPSFSTPPQRSIATDSAMPLDWERPKSKRALLLIVGGALAVVVAIVIFATRGSGTSEPDKPKPDTKLVVKDPDPKPEKQPDPKPEKQPETQTDGSAAPKVDDPIEMDPVVRPPVKPPVKPDVKKPDVKPPEIPDDLEDDEEGRPRCRCDHQALRGRGSRDRGDGETVRRGGGREGPRRLPADPDPGRDRHRGEA